MVSFSDKRLHAESFIQLSFMDFFLHISLHLLRRHNVRFIEYTGSGTNASQIYSKGSRLDSRAEHRPF